MSPFAHPATAAGLAVVSTGGGLLVEGGPTRRLFTGSAAYDLLPRLLPLLDGRTSLPAVAEMLSVPAAQVAQAVALLHRSGLLHDGPVDRADAADAFLSRAVAATASRQPAGLRKRLAEAAVVVTAAGPLGDLVAADLTQSGIGMVTAELIPDAALAVATDDRLAEVAATGTPVLRIGGDDRGVELGPLFTGPDTSCPRCFLGGEGPGRPVDVLSIAAVQLLSALAVAEAVGWLTQLSAPATGRRMHRIDTATLERGIHEVTPSAGCPACTLTDDSPIGRLEWLNRRPSWPVPADRTVPVTPDLDLASSPRIPLSETPLWLRTLLPAATARPNADTYLLAADGLPHPVYRWSPAQQALIAARGDLASCPPIAGLLPNPAAVLVFVAPVARLTHAYAEQSLRRAFLAAGRAVAAVTLASADHDAVLADTVDPALADLLELREGGEHLAAVVGLYPRRP